MVEQEVGKKSDNNMKIAVTIIIILVGLLAVAVFALQQNKNENNTASESSSTESNQNTQSTQDSSNVDAGAIGKNEMKFTDDNFQTEVIDYQGVVLIDFYASWCPHCKNVAKDVTAVADELAGKARVGKLDVEESSTTSNKYEVKGTPTFIIFKNGQEVERASGERTKQQLLDMVNKHL